MPRIIATDDRVEVTVPAIEDMGSTFTGRRCQMIRAMAEGGGMTLESLCSGLRMRKRDAREVLGRMVDEGTVLKMSSDGRTTYFLADRNGWRGRIALVDGPADPHRGFRGPPRRRKRS